MNRRALPAAAVRMGGLAVLAMLLAVGTMVRAGQEDVFDVPKEGQDEQAEREPQRRPRPQDDDPAPTAAGDESDSPEPEEVAEPEPESKPEPVRRRRPPTKEQQANAERTVKEVYKADYAKAASRAELPEKLLEQAGESADDPATEFVLLREARDLAAAGGDFATAARAADALAEGFKVDARAMKADLLTTAAKSARSPEAATAAVDLAMDLVNGAIARDDYKAAEQVAATARELAKRTKDKSVVAAARERSAEVRALSGEYGKVRAAKEKLADEPDDPAANFLVGRHLCLTKGQWDEGLPLLAKGSDPTLRDLARQELARPAEPAAVLKLADGWWAAADKAAENGKPAARARAAHWYERAEPNLTGIKKALAAARIAEARQPAAAATTGTAAASGGLPLLRWVDVKKDAVAGRWELKGGTLLSEPQGGTRIEFPYQPPEEYDFRIEFSYVTGTGSTVVQMLTYKGTPFIWVMGAAGSTFHYLGDNADGAHTATVSPPWPAKEGQRYTSVVKVRRNGVKAYLDGELVCELETNYKGLGAGVWSLRDPRLIGVGTDSAQVSFHSAALVEVTGTGKRTRRQ